MGARVLSVGQCGMDHAALADLLAERFGATVVPVDSRIAALDRLAADSFDLVLVNRLLDRDGTDGLDVIRAIKQESRLESVPVMLVSNYPEAQAAASAAGAAPGFGKRELGDTATIAKLAAFLPAREARREH